MRSIGTYLAAILLLAVATAESSAQFRFTIPTPFFDAVRRGDVATVKKLLDQGSDVKATDEEGMTPLYRAALYGGDFDMVRLLVEHGADVNVEWNSYTP